MCSRLYFLEKSFETRGETRYSKAMPLAASAHASLVHGAPRVTRHGGHVRVVQSPVVGWALLGFGLGLPAAIIFSEFGGLPPDLPARLLRAWAGAEGMARFGMIVFVLFSGALSLYGLFWLLWRRELDIDVNVGRWRFVSGLPLARRILEGRKDDAFIAELQRQLRSASFVQGGEMVNPSSGAPLESWELRLAIPGNAEPLFLGEWGQKEEALAEIEAWRAILPRLAVAESGADA